VYESRVDRFSVSCGHRALETAPQFLRAFCGTAPYRLCGSQGRAGVASRAIDGIMSMLAVVLRPGRVVIGALTAYEEQCEQENHEQTEQHDDRPHTDLSGGAHRLYSARILCTAEGQHNQRPRSCTKIKFCTGFAVRIKKNKLSKRRSGSWSTS
jgi:hypothetical protein